MAKASEKTISRLSLYRRLLNSLRYRGVKRVFSRELAAMAMSTPAQIRRDLMGLSCAGTPARGYSVVDLITAIGRVLDAPKGQRVALVGVGNIGRSVLAFFAGRRPKLSIVAAFDNDLAKVHRVVHGCPCYPLSDLGRVVAELDITLGIIAVPVRGAQKVADALMDAGVKGLLNFAPTPIRIRDGVYVDDVDFTSSLERVAYFARQ